MDNNKQTPIESSPIEASHLESSDTIQKIPPTSRSAKLNVKFIVIGFCAVLTLLVLFALINIFFLHRSKDTLVDRRQITIDNITPIPDPTSDWKTYEVGKYGFSIKYPDSYAISDDLNTGEYATVYKKGEEMHIISLKVIDNPENVSLQDKIPTITDMDPNYSPSYKNIIIDGTNAEETTFPHPIGCTYTSVFIAKNSKIYEITNYCSQISTKEFDQILSTFKFTNTQNNSTVDISCKQDSECMISDINANHCCLDYSSANAIAVNSSWASSQPGFQKFCNMLCIQSVAQSHQDYSAICKNSICQKVKN